MTNKKGLMITLGLGLVACGGPDQFNSNGNDRDEAEFDSSFAKLLTGGMNRVVTTPFVAPDGVWTVTFDDATLVDDDDMLVMELPTDVRSFATMADFESFIQSSFGAQYDLASGALYYEAAVDGPVYTDVFLSDPVVAQILEIEDAELAFVGGKAGGVNIAGTFYCLDDNGCPAGMAYPSYLQLIDEDMEAEPGDDDYGQEFYFKARLGGKTSELKWKFKTGIKRVPLHTSARVKAKIKSRQGKRFLRTETAGRVFAPTFTEILKEREKTKNNGRRLDSRRSIGAWGTDLGVRGEWEGICGNHRVTRSGSTPVARIFGDEIHPDCNDIEMNNSPLL